MQIISTNRILTIFKLFNEFTESYCPNMTFIGKSQPSTHCKENKIFFKKNFFEVFKSRSWRYGSEVKIPTLAKDKSLIPSTHIRELTVARGYRSSTPFWPPWALHLYVHIDNTQRYTHI